MTKPESQFASILTCLGFEIKDSAADTDLPNTVYPQYRLGRYVFDFSIPALRMLLEVDGNHWHPSGRRLSAAQAMTGIRDEEKTSYAQSQGWFVVRVQQLF
jgi:very-short-patch-repair endonuclease